MGHVCTRMVGRGGSLLVRSSYLNAPGSADELEQAVQKIEIGPSPFEIMSLWRILYRYRAIEQMLRQDLEDLIC